MRILRILVFAGIGAIAFQCPPVSIAQQSLAKFDEVDFFYSEDPQRFSNLWLDARSQTVRIAVLGDSQEASPISHGFRYLPLLNYEMWKRFGNAPETPIEGCFLYGGGSSPPANWLVSGRCGTPGPAVSRLSGAQILPSVRATAFSTLDGAANITGGTHGQLTMLQPDAIDVDSGTGIATNAAYFNRSGVVKARIFAATNPSSGEIAYHVRPDDAHSPSYTTAVTASGTIDLVLQSPSIAIKSGETAPLDFAGKRYLALEVFGTSDSQLTDLVGLRFYNETHAEGVVIDSFSLGGYAAFTFLRDHADAGAMFRAFGYRAAVLHYGANSNGRSTPQQFKADLADLIARLRAWMDDPQFPVILIADVYQSRLTAQELAENDQYAGAQLAIAQTDSNVMVINARRLTQDVGWNADSGQASQYLEDGVHYTALGARVLASAVAAAMLGEIHASGCLADPGSVSLQAMMTLVVDLGGTTACASHGQLSAADSLRVNGAALKVALTNGFVPASGDSFKILASPVTSGSFASLELPALAQGLSWDTTALYTQGTIGVAAPSPAPPPAPAAPAAGRSGGGGNLDLMSLLALFGALLRLLRKRTPFGVPVRRLLTFRPRCRSTLHAKVA